jgi:hypothetical protein
MEKFETAQLVLWMQGVDGRVMNELSVEVWHDLVGHLPYEAALGAVREHYREEHRKVMPSDVLERVQAHRELGVLPSATDELLAEEKAAWCEAHGVTVEEYDANQHDYEWVLAVSRG